MALKQMMRAFVRIYNLKLYFFYIVLTKSTTMFLFYFTFIISTVSNGTDGMITPPGNKTDDSTIPSHNSTDLSYEKLVTLSHDMSTMLDSGELETRLNVAIISHEVTEPVLPPPDVTNINSKTNKYADKSPCM